jgi:hypothetical protein
MVALAGCDRPVHEPVKVIAAPRAAPEAPLVALPEPAAASPAPVAASASAPNVAQRTEPIRRPGFIPADQMPMRQGESGNETFKRAIAERLCKGQQASGVPCN